MTLYFRGTMVPVSRQLSHTSFGKSALALLLMSASMLAGCSHLQKPPEIALDDPAEPAVLQADPPAQVEVVELPKPLPLPGQLKPLPGNKHTPEAADPAARVNQANAAARVQPVRNGLSTRYRSIHSPVARSIRSIPRRAKSPTLRSRPASSSLAPAPSPPAIPCAGSSATPRAEPALPKRSTSCSSQRDPISSPISSSTPIGGPISSN